MTEIKIEGWFPPAIIVSPTSGIKYAVCGGKWTEIDNALTIEQVTKLWVCTAKTSLLKIKESTYPKRISRKQLVENILPNSIKSIAKKDVKKSTLILPAGFVMPKPPIPPTFKK